MNKATQKTTTRREFFKNTGRIAAASALAAGVVPKVYAAQDNTIKLALIGCGGRGTGAVRDALSIPDAGPIKLYVGSESSSRSRCWHQTTSSSSRQRAISGHDARRMSPTPGAHGPSAAVRARSIAAANKSKGIPAVSSM